MAVTCNAFSTERGGACGQPGALVAAGCVHEHVTSAPTCRAHLAEVDAGKMLCAHCLNHKTDPHRCVRTRPALSRPDGDYTKVGLALGVLRV